MAYSGSITYDLQAGNNLRAFPFETLSDGTTEITPAIIAEFFTGSDCRITGIAGASVASAPVYNPATGFSWVGSLTALSPKEGYWLKTAAGNTCPPVAMTGSLIEQNYVNTYHGNANLLAYPFVETKPFSEVWNDMSASIWKGIIDEGRATMYVSGSGWVGSLTSFVPGQGFWAVKPSGSQSNISHNPFVISSSFNEVGEEYVACVDGYMANPFVDSDGPFLQEEGRNSIQDCTFKWQLYGGQYGPPYQGFAFMNSQYPSSASFEFGNASHSLVRADGTPILGSGSRGPVVGFFTSSVGHPAATASKEVCLSAAVWEGHPGENMTITITPTTSGSRMFFPLQWNDSYNSYPGVPHCSSGSNLYLKVYDPERDRVVRANLYSSEGVLRHANCCSGSGAVIHIDSINIPPESFSQACLKGFTYIKTDE